MRRSDEGFRAWMALVDREVTGRVGLGVYDLPDMLHRDAYDDGIAPDDWANEVIASAAEDMGFDPEEFCF